LETSYKYIRLKWQADNEDAKDLTQGFFANAFEKNHFARYDAARPAFKLSAHVSRRLCRTNAKAGKRLKRGGDMDHYQLDFAQRRRRACAHAVTATI
jgi:hypothetical protein